MNVEQLKVEVEAYRKSLNENAGKVCFTNETGPVGMDMIDAIIRTLEAQERRLSDLDKQK